MVRLIAFVVVPWLLAVPTGHAQELEPLPEEVARTLAEQILAVQYPDPHATGDAPYRILETSDLVTWTATGQRLRIVAAKFRSHDEHENEARYDDLERRGGLNIPPQTVELGELTEADGAVAYVLADFSQWIDYTFAEDEYVPVSERMPNKRGTTFVSIRKRFPTLAAATAAFQALPDHRHGDTDFFACRTLCDEELAVCLNTTPRSDWMTSCFPEYHLCGSDCP